MVNEANSTIGGGNVVSLGVTTGAQAFLNRLSELRTSLDAAYRDDTPTPPPETLARWTNTLLNYTQEANTLGAFGRPSEFEHLKNDLTQLKYNKDATPEVHMTKLSAAIDTLALGATKVVQQQGQQRQL